MVKNTVGGSKTKGFARKAFTQAKSTFVRIPTNEFEHIACVTKVFGNGRIEVKTTYDVIVQSVIRNKFRGKTKKNNMISVGSFLLIGLYDWEKPKFKNSDVMDVYSPDDILLLYNINSVRFAEFESRMRNYVNPSSASFSNHAISETDDVIFSTNEMYDDDILLDMTSPDTDDVDTYSVSNQVTEDFLFDI